MKKREELIDFHLKRKCTLLGVGPMSKNCVDASIELANHHNVPLMLIASRRQIDSEEFNGGYVNNWSTKDFANYVREKDKKNKIILARDHGGPWQNNLEVKKGLSLNEAMSSAKLSFKRDIQAGFDMLHIDPSIDIHSSPSQKEVINRIIDLYEFCFKEAKKNNKDIFFEIGTEEQSGTTNNPEDLSKTLDEIYSRCLNKKLPKPTFVVIQSGTRVMEMRNVGSFDQPLRVKGQLAVEIQVPKMIDICNKYRIMMKAHNTDYLSNESLLWHRRLGIHAVNVAPEFGVIESKTLLDTLRKNSLHSLAERFVKISYSSKKWKKWMIKNTKASVEEKAIISGHYIFSNDAFLELKEEASIKLKEKSLDLDLILKDSVKNGIERYLKNLRIIN